MTEEAAAAAVRGGVESAVKDRRNKKEMTKKPRRPQLPEPRPAPPDQRRPGRQRPGTIGHPHQRLPGRQTRQRLPGSGVLARYLKELYNTREVVVYGHRQTQKKIYRKPRLSKIESYKAAYIKEVWFRLK